MCSQTNEPPNTAACNREPMYHSFSTVALTRCSGFVLMCLYFSTGLLTLMIHVRWSVLQAEVWVWARPNNEPLAPHRQARPEPDCDNELFAPHRQARSESDCDNKLFAPHHSVRPESDCDNKLFTPHCQARSESDCDNELFAPHRQTRSEHQVANIPAYVVHRISTWQSISYQHEVIWSENEFKKHSHILMSTSII
jgi:hypothetical protein